MIAAATMQVFVHARAMGQGLQNRGDRRSAQCRRPLADRRSAGASTSVQR
jgi:hypothetical protein